MVVVGLGGVCESEGAENTLSHKKTRLRQMLLVPKYAETQKLEGHFEKPLERPEKRELLLFFQTPSATSPLGTFSVSPLRRCVP